MVMTDGTGITGAIGTVAAGTTTAGATAAITGLAIITGTEIHLSMNLWILIMVQEEAEALQHLQIQKMWEAEEE